MPKRSVTYGIAIVIGVVLAGVCSYAADRYQMSQRAAFMSAPGPEAAGGGCGMDMAAGGCDMEAGGCAMDGAGPMPTAASAGTEAEATGDALKPGGCPMHATEAAAGAEAPEAGGCPMHAAAKDGAGSAKAHGENCDGDCADCTCPGGECTDECMDEHADECADDCSHDAACPAPCPHDASTKPAPSTT